MRVPASLSGLSHINLEFYLSDRNQITPNGDLGTTDILLTDITEWSAESLVSLKGELVDGDSFAVTAKTQIEVTKFTILYSREQQTYGPTEKHIARYMHTL